MCHHLLDWATKKNMRDMNMGGMGEMVTGHRYDHDHGYIFGGRHKTTVLCCSQIEGSNTQ